MIFKNAAGQGVYLTVVSLNGAAVIGLSATITANLSKDGAVAVGTSTANPTEIGGGVYWLPLSQGETNANALALMFTTTTPGVYLDPIIAYTTAGTVPMVAAGSSGGLPLAGTGGKVAATVATGDDADAASVKATIGVAGAGLTAVALVSSGLDAVVVEAGVNARQALAPILAASAGLLSGAGTGTIVIKGGNVATTRITATTDDDGNRTAVTLALPA